MRTSPRSSSLGESQIEADSPETVKYPHVEHANTLSSSLQYTEHQIELRSSAKEFAFECSQEYDRSLKRKLIFDVFQFSSGIYFKSVISDRTFYDFMFRINFSHDCVRLSVVLIYFFIDSFTFTEIKKMSVFKNYEPGEPTCRLYVKNIAKQVEEKVSIWITFT